MAARSLCALSNRGESYCDLRFIGLPIATRKMADLPIANDEKKLITSSSKKVSPFDPAPGHRQLDTSCRSSLPPPTGRPGSRGSRIAPV